MFPVETVIDDKYGVNAQFRVYYVPEGKGLEEYARIDYRNPIEFDGNDVPLIYLQLTRNPMTRKFVPYAIYYRADTYTDDDILGNPNLGQIAEKCTYCQSHNKVAEAIEKPGSAIASVSQQVQQIQRPIGQMGMDLGNVVTPGMIPAAVDVFTKVFCEPFGEAIIKLGVSGLASIAAGWAAEGGTQAAWRKISEDIVRDYKVCPTDIPKIQQNVVAMKDALEKDRGNIVGAMSKGALKDFKKIASEHGFDVKGDFQATISGKGQASASMRRGSGRAID